jgi:hypothetical protein
MANKEQSPRTQLPMGCVLAPIHVADESTPLSICILVQMDDNSTANPFILLRDLPGMRVYLGSICDAQAAIQEWVEIHVQTIDVEQLAFSGYQEQLSNLYFDTIWHKEGITLRNQMPGIVIGTKMEIENPGPVLIKRFLPENGSFVPVEATSWRVCKDDSLLRSHDLPAYTAAHFRYLHQPDAKDTRTFLA